MTRALIVIIWLALAGYCAFGFAATFEYDQSGRRLAWQAAYGAIGVGCLMAARRRARRN